MSGSHWTAGARIVTAEELTAPRNVAAELTVPPVVRPGICMTCRGIDYTLGGACQQCTKIEAALGGPLEPAVLAASYVRPSTLRDWLSHYKLNDETDVDEAAQTALAEVFSGFFDAWSALAAPRFDSVIVVPSTRSEGDHPLQVALTGRRQDLPFKTLLRAGPSPTGHNHPSRTGFSALEDVAGSRTIVVDDVYTTGARAQSAVAALRDAGADVVALIVLARRFNLDYAPEVGVLWTELTEVPYSFQIAARRAITATSTESP
ncbi:ComF family protein [Curtobacterium sp. SAFR-003]|uniref:ComF family protein n=1 Tax=Curtobacterium sp. SAFR-003 TaxID=3387276 RepID=UPI003F7D5601